TATFVVSHTRSLPRSRRPAMTASMTESCTMTRETGTMPGSPTFAWRAATREGIFSASVRGGLRAAKPPSTVLGDDPLAKQGIELIHRQRAGVGQSFDPPRDLAQLVLAEFEAKLLRAMVDRVLSGEAVRDVDRSLKAKVCGVQDLVAVRVEIDRLRVHAGLVVERVLAGHEVVVGDL